MGSTIFKCGDTTTNFFQSLLLLLFRLYWGFLFFVGGVFKLANMDSFTAFFAHLGLSTGLAYIVALLELACGILLFLGLLSRLAAAITAIIMFSAYIIAHPAQFHSFFNDPQFFFSAPSFSFLMVSLVILFFGAGLFSIDGVIKRKKMKKEGCLDHKCGENCPHGDLNPPGNKPPENKPPEQKPFGMNPAGNKPPENKPPENKPPENKPPENKPPENKPPENKPPENKPPENKPPENKEGPK